MVKNSASLLVEGTFNLSCRSFLVFFILEPSKKNQWIWTTNRSLTCYSMLFFFVNECSDKLYLFLYHSNLIFLLNRNEVYYRQWSVRYHSLYFANIYIYILVWRIEIWKKIFFFCGLFCEILNIQTYEIKRRSFKDVYEFNRWRQKSRIFLWLKSKWISTNFDWIQCHIDNSSGWFISATV